MAPPQTTLQKKYKTSKNKCNLDIFGSYCGTVLQYSIRGSGGGGGSVENNNEMQTFKLTLKGYRDVSGWRWVS